MDNIYEFNVNLYSKITSHDKIIIIPHDFPDVDALSSSFAMAKLVKNCNKSVYIVINDRLNKLDNSARLIINNIKNDVSLINASTCNKMCNNNDLIIILDTCNKNNICLNNTIGKNTIVIDHHIENDNKIESYFKYIDVNSSSTSEIVFKLLILNNIVVTPYIANILLAGIYLDTNKFQSVYNPDTMYIISELMKKGANINVVKKIFYHDFENDRKVQNLLNKAEFITKKLVMCVDNKDIIYTRAELARVADYLLRFKIDASFAAGFIDNDIVSISARSNGILDVSKTMEKFGGGGSSFRAAAKIETNDINEVENKLRYTIKKRYK